MRAVALTGSVATGFKAYGPFDDVDQAADWAEARQPLIGHVTVLYLETPGSHPVKPVNIHLDADGSEEAILAYVKKYGFLFQPCHRGEFQERGCIFSEKAYTRFVNDISHDLKKEEVNDGGFSPHYLMRFERNGTKFVLRLMIGQGSQLDLFTEEYYNANFGNTKLGE